MATVPLQAAIVTMLIAQRPALVGLTINWELSADGQIWARLSHDAPSSAVPEIAAEMSLALGSDQCAVRDGISATGRKFRLYQVYGEHTGIPVNFSGYQYFDEADQAGEAGEQS